jgi:hypothetical protein
LVTDIRYTDLGALYLSFSTQIIFSSEYFHYKIFIHDKCLQNENDEFQKSLSQPSIIDARAHYWAAARRLRSPALVLCTIYRAFKKEVTGFKWIQYSLN